MKKCSEENCHYPHLARGYCQKHYSYYRHKGILNTKRLDPTPCSVDGCNKKSIALKYCAKHYQRLKNSGKLILDKEVLKSCGFEGCQNITNNNREYCQNCYSKIKMRQYQNQPNHRFSIAKKNAKKRKIIWNLDKDVYFNLINNPCYYCNNIYTNCGVGLDRIDNSLGYEITNVIPCCKFCNMLRNDLLTVEETKLIIENLKAIRNTNSLWDNIY